MSLHNYRKWFSFFFLLFLTANPIKVHADDRTIELPPDTKTIEEEAFCGLGEVEEIRIPDGVEYIGSRAFAGTYTDTIVVPDSIQYMAEDAFEESVILVVGEDSYARDRAIECGYSYSPEGLEYAFDDQGIVITGCANDAEKISIPDYILGKPVYKIGYGAFKDHPISHISLPDTLRIIEGCAFKNCGNWCDEMNIPDGVTYIGIGAFDECKQLTGDLIIPDSVTYIGPNAFSYCYGLTGKLVLPENISTIEDMTFFRCYHLSGELVIPDSVTIIKYAAFQDCHELSGDLIIPDGVTYIGIFAFMNCNKLTGDIILLPESVKEVGERAFERSGTHNFIYIPAGCSTYANNRGIGIDSSRIRYGIPYTNTIKSVSYRQTGEINTFTILFDAFNGDAVYELYASDSVYGKYELAAQSSSELHGYKSIVHAVRSDEPVYYRIKGEHHMTTAFSPYEVPLGFRYELLADNTARITDVYSGSTVTEICVPETIDGKTVSDISTEVFKIYPHLEVIYLPWSLQNCAGNLELPGENTRIEYTDNMYPDVIDEIRIFKDVSIQGFTVYIDKLPEESGKKYFYELHYSPVKDGDYQMVDDNLDDSGYGPSLYHSGPIQEEAWFKIKITETKGDVITGTGFTEPVDAFDGAYNKVTYRAILIGESAFDDPNLTGGRNASDVAHMETMLRSVNDGKIQVRSYTDINWGDIQAGTRDILSRADNNDVSIFFFASHGCSAGLTDEEQAGDLLMPDMSRVHFSDLRDLLDTVDGTKVVFLETCLSGVAINLGLFEAPEYFVITAGSDEEMTVGTDVDMFSGNVFTYALVNAIGRNGDMPADCNPQNSVVTMGELFDYVKTETYDDSSSWLYWLGGYEPHTPDKNFEDGNGFPMFWR